MWSRLCLTYHCFHKVITELLPEMADLKGKVAIITGASGGIGGAAAVEFAKSGTKVCITGRNEQKLAETKQRCLEAGLSDRDILVVPADVLREDDIKVIVDKTIEKFQQLDILVNSAGHAVTGGFFRANVQDVDDMYQMHVKATFNLVKLAVPHLIQTKGCIVNVSSVAGTRPIPYAFAYGLAKAAVNLMTEMLAVELGPKGIRVNCVSPGIIKTDIFIKPGAHMSHAPEKVPQFYESMATAHPLGKVGEPEEVAKTIVFLSSPAAGFISGSILSVDGARHCTCSVPQIQMSV